MTYKSPEDVLFPWRDRGPELQRMATPRMKYKLVTAVCGPVPYDYPMNDLEKEVNELITQGWEPLGGVSSYYQEHYGPAFAQAMIYGKKK